MDWKNFAKDKLRQYDARRQAISIIPLEIAQVESQMTEIRSAQTDRLSVCSNRVNAYESKLLSCMVQKEELQRNLKQAKLFVKSVDAALNALNPDDRKILERMHISVKKYAAEDLADELNIDLKTVYSRASCALHRFTIALYGITES